MKRRALRTLLVMAVAVGLMVVTAIPSHANVGTSDPTCDVVDPLIGIHPLVPGYHTCAPGEADLTSWNTRSGGSVSYTAGTSPVTITSPTIRAQFKVTSTLPVVGSTTLPVASGYPSFNGFTYHANFQNHRIQDNDPADPLKATGQRAPLCTTPIYPSNTGHYANHYWFQVGISITYSGGEYKATPFVSEYDPNLDGGFIFRDLNANPYLVPGSTFTWGFMNGTTEVPATWSTASSKWIHSSPTDTIYVKVPTKIAAASAQACNGFLTADYGATGDSIKNNWASSWQNQVVVLPVTVPLSTVPGESDIDAIGGFIYRSDWAQNSAYNPHPNDLVAVGSEHLGTFNVPGHDCWTPTVGGVIPSNPLHSPGNPCGVNNPLGSQYTWSGLDFTL